MERVRYYLIEEDRFSEHKIYLGEISLAYPEKMAMATGNLSQIPQTPLRIPIKYRTERMSDYLSFKFTFVSANLKKLICTTTATSLFFRPIVLLFHGEEYPFYLIIPKKFDCIDFERSYCMNDDTTPGGIRVNHGFTIRPNVVEKADIFRVKGLSNRKLVISERLKEIFEQNDVCGAKYISTEDFHDD